MYFSFADNQIDFASFLEIMHKHSQREKCQQEIMAAFQAHESRGAVPAKDLMHILTNYGEKLNKPEGT